MDKKTVIIIAAAIIMFLVMFVVAAQMKLTVQVKAPILKANIAQDCGDGSICETFITLYSNGEKNPEDGNPITKSQMTALTEMLSELDTSQLNTTTCDLGIFTPAQSSMYYQFPVKDREHKTTTGTPKYYVCNNSDEPVFILLDELFPTIQ